MKRKIVIVILVLSALLGFNAYVFAQHQHGTAGKKVDADKAEKPKKTYRCSMHPQVVSDKPGKCPICGMELVEVASGEEKESEEALGESVVKLKEGQQELIGVKVEPITGRPLMRMIRTVAKIAFDPELYKAETELIQTVKLKNNLTPSNSQESIQRADALILATELKLKLMGLSDEQIEELKARTESDRSLIISDSASQNVWAYLTLYEYDLGAVKIGDHVIFKTVAYPGEEFSGRIVAIDPVLDMNTRSVRARVKVDNPEGKIKPNMYADAFIHVDLGEKLALPKEAVLDTGLRKIVYVGLGKGRFASREVELGQEAVALVDGKEAEFYPVFSGLKENEAVVTSGAFLIDSQSQLTGGMSALWGGATEIKQEGKTEEETEVKTQHQH